MDYTSVDYVDSTEIYEVLNNNADLLNSNKGRFYETIEGITHILYIPLAPFVCTILSCTYFSKWHHKILSSVISSLLVTPLVVLVSGLNVVAGIISIPLSLIFEGIPSLFSKKFNKELKLSLSLKKLNNYVRKTNKNLSTYFKLFSPNIRHLIDEINALNNELGRNENNEYVCEGFVKDKNKDIIEEEIVLKSNTNQKQHDIEKEQ